MERTMAHVGFEDRRTARSGYDRSPYDDDRDWRARFDRDRFDRDDDRRLGRPYARGDYDRDDRGLVDRASDEVRSWFGDDAAERRRRRDAYYERMEDRYDRNLDRGDDADDRARRAYASGRFFYEGRDYDDDRSWGDRGWRPRYERDRSDWDDGRERAARRGYDPDDYDRVLEERYDRDYNRAYARDYGDHRGYRGRFERERPDDGRAFRDSGYGRGYGYADDDRGYGGRYGRRGYDYDFGDDRGPSGYGARRGFTGRADFRDRGRAY